MDRRAFLRTAGAVLPTGLVGTATAPPAPGSVRPGPKKLSCNLYSFNSVLRSGEMSLEQVLRFCADLRFDAVDPTGYYFPGYPALPPDEYVREIKRKAFRMGLDVSGTGIRNDFTLPDPERRRAEVELVKRWVGFAARLDAPVLRVFSGLRVPESEEEEARVTGWVVDALRECAAYSGEHGVIIVLQNHADFIRTAEQTARILDAVDSEWLALNLDIGSFRTGDPYAEVDRVASYAATWQIKENLYVDGVEQKTDLRRIMRIVRDSGYHGYLPIETLGPGDPREKVPRFLAEVREAMAAEGMALC